MSFLLTIESAILLCESDLELVAYLQFKKLILNEKKCRKCKKKCYIYRLNDKFIFKCPKCRKWYETAPKPFFLNKIKIKYVTFFEILIYFLANIPIVSVLKLVKISKTILIDYYNFFREVCCNEIFNCKEKIGGINKIVEVDESLFGRRKYNKGRIVEGQWVVGGIERGSGKCFLVPVVNRNSETLKEILKEYVAPGTTVITDEWKGYRKLEEIDLNHLKVNHSINFVDPQTSAHTNTIESEWGKIKNKLPRAGRYRKHFISYLATYMWKKGKGKDDIVENFIEAIVRQQGI